MSSTRRRGRISSWQRREGNEDPVRVLIALMITGLLLVSSAVAAETAQYYFDQGIVFNDRGRRR